MRCVANVIVYSLQVTNSTARLLCMGSWTCLMLALLDLQFRIYILAMVESTDHRCSWSAYAPPPFFVAHSPSTRSSLAVKESPWPFGPAISMYGVANAGCAAAACSCGVDSSMARCPGSKMAATAWGLMQAYTQTHCWCVPCPPPLKCVSLLC
jgi:hypothetical protein